MLLKKIDPKRLKDDADFHAHECEHCKVVYSILNEINKENRVDENYHLAV